jgi:hypothetical protein
MFRKSRPVQFWASGHMDKHRGRYPSDETSSITKQKYRMETI